MVVIGDIARLNRGGRIVLNDVSIDAQPQARINKGMHVWNPDAVECLRRSVRRSEQMHQIGHDVCRRLADGDVADAGARVHRMLRASRSTSR